LKLKRKKILYFCAKIRENNKIEKGNEMSDFFDTITVKVPSHVERGNEDLYIAAARNSMIANAIKGRRKKWLAAGDDHQELKDWLSWEGQYARVENPDEKALEGETMPHPLCKKMWDGDFGLFLMKLAHTLLGGHQYEEDWVEYGSLSEKQTAIVRKALARAKKWEEEKTEREISWAKEAEKREHVGEVGDKQFEVKGTVSFVTSWDGTYGTTYLTVIRDADDNTIKYKGKFLAEKGDSVEMIATVKSHEEYKGEKQTIVNRPRKIKINGEDD
jgi:hypothetical protein